MLCTLELAMKQDVAGTYDLVCSFWAPDEWCTRHSSWQLGTVHHHSTQESPCPLCPLHCPGAGPEVIEFPPCLSVLYGCLWFRRDVINVFVNGGHAKVKARLSSRQYSIARLKDTDSKDTSAQRGGFMIITVHA